LRRSATTCERVAGLHLAINADAPFAADLFDLGKDRAVGISQDLRHPVMVAQVDEQDAPVVADPVHPTGKADGLAHMGGVEVGAGMAAIGVHGSSPEWVFSGSGRYIRG
jgi:flagellar basal body rod protein FlgC